MDMSLRVLGIVCRMMKNRGGELFVHHSDPRFASLRVEDTSHVGLVVAGSLRGESVAVQDHVLLALSPSRNEDELSS